MNTAEMIQVAKENRGGTFRVDSSGYWDIVDFDSGFYVAKEGGVENWPIDLGSAMIDAIVRKWGFGRAIDLYLGLWKDDKGNWSIDQTVWFQFRESAEYYGRFNEQRAIWDIRNQTEIIL